MSERDKGGSQFRAAIIVPEAVHEVRDGFEVLAVGLRTDQEVLDEAIRELESRIGSPVLRLTPDQARMERNRFCFSSSVWNAPWEPAGPKAFGEPRLS